MQDVPDKQAHKAFAFMWSLMPPGVASTPRIIRTQASAFRRTQQEALSPA